DRRHRVLGRMADLRWRINYKDRDYEFNAHRDLTLVRLRQCKHWFGPDYGKFLPFISLLGQGDADAWACAIWIARRKAGDKNIPEPANMDFPVGEIMADMVAVDDDDEDPTSESESEDEQTDDSRSTPTDSDTSTSST